MAPRVFPCGVCFWAVMPLKMKLMSCRRRPLNQAAHRNSDVQCHVWRKALTFFQSLRNPFKSGQRRM